MKKIVILGAGISGLSVAWYLSRQIKDCQIILLESSERVGGWIQTINQEGCLFERGPKALRFSDNSHLSQLIDALDLKDEVVEAAPGAKRRYLLVKGALQTLSPLFFLKQGLLGGCLKELITSPRADETEETIAEFFNRRFGMRFSERVIDPMVRGIFGGNINELSMNACFPKILQWEKEYGSILRSFIENRRKKQRIISFKEGMETLPRRLYEKLLSQVDIRLGQRARAIHYGKHIAIQTSTETIMADRLISTIPAYALASLAQDQAGLSEIFYQSLTVVNCAYDEDFLPKKGFGFLVPSSESTSFLGMSFDTSIFPMRKKGAQTLFSMLFLGEPLNAHAFSMKILDELFGIKKEPLAIDIFHAKSAIPQYTLGHMQRLECAPAPPLFLAGNYLRGVGIPDCINEARLCAESVLATL